jgi:site-specific recombinase XerD
MRIEIQAGSDGPGDHLALAPTADPQIVTLTPDQNPALVYLGSLASGSRRTMKHALDTIAAIVDPTLSATTFPWHLLEHQHTAAIRSQLAERFAPSNTNKMLSALRGVLRAAFNLNLMSADQLARAISIKAVRGSRVPKGRALQAGEIRALFAVCNPKTPNGARNAAVLALLYGGGLRRSEVVDLDLSSFERSSGKLIVLGKGNKERTIYLTNGGLRAVEAWLGHRGDDPGPLLHPVRKGGLILRRRMNDQSILDLVSRLARKAGVDQFSPHDLRRTAVGDLLDAGVDLSTVQKLAGHESPATTGIYDRRGERAKMRAAEMLHVPFLG